MEPFTKAVIRIVPAVVSSLRIVAGLLPFRVSLLVQLFRSFLPSIFTYATHTAEEALMKITK